MCVSVALLGFAPLLMLKNHTVAETLPQSPVAPGK
jgi:hypothetical protein